MEIYQTKVGSKIQIHYLCKLNKICYPDIAKFCLLALRPNTFCLEIPKNDLIHWHRLLEETKFINELLIGIQNGIMEYRGLNSYQRLLCYLLAKILQLDIEEIIGCKSTKKLRQHNIFCDPFDEECDCNHLHQKQQIDNDDHEMLYRIPRTKKIGVLFKYPSEQKVIWKLCGLKELSSHLHFFPKEIIQVILNYLEKK